MKRHYLLIVGLILVTASACGTLVQRSSGSRADWPRQHMTRSGHMGWIDSFSSAPSTIDGAREIVVTSTEFGFSPSSISTTVGESINVVLVNSGSVTHDWSIPELGLSVVARPGQQTATGFTIDAEGTYRVVCSIPGHAEAGMVGQLEAAGSPSS